jgi:hypothetical protein
MQNSKLAKKMLQYLPVFLVLAATVVGLMIGKYLNPMQLPTESNKLQPPVVLGTLDPCSFTIYTSLPPKCKTLEGKFIPLPGSSSTIFVTP